MNDYKKYLNTRLFYQPGIQLVGTIQLPDDRLSDFWTVIHVTDLGVLNGTTSVPKSFLRYSVDKVRQESESEV